MCTTSNIARIQFLGRAQSLDKTDTPKHVRRTDHECMLDDEDSIVRGDKTLRSSLGFQTVLPLLLSSYPVILHPAPLLLTCCYCWCRFHHSGPLVSCWCCWCLTKPPDTIPGPPHPSLFCPPCLSPFTCYCCWCTFGHSVPLSLARRLKPPLAPIRAAHLHLTPYTSIHPPPPPTCCSCCCCCRLRHNGPPFICRSCCCCCCPPSFPRLKDFSSLFFNRCSTPDVSRACVHQRKKKK